jgi:anti-sigma B factor antagonist
MSTTARNPGSVDRLTSEALTATDLEIIFNEKEGTTLVFLRGRLSLDSSPLLRDQLLKTIRKPETETLVVDMAEVSSIDASGIATLFEALKVARNCETTLRLRGLRGRVLRLFEVTGFLHLFDANSYREAASGARVPR